LLHGLKNLFQALKLHSVCLKIEMLPKLLGSTVLTINQGCEF
jgi:hypothetical protein